METATSLDTIYSTLKEVVKEFSTSFNDVREQTGRIELWNKGDLIIDGRKRKDIYLCGLIIKSNYVGFYYMPIYAEPKIKELLSPQLVKLLKGMSCFHIKKLDDSLISDIRFALNLGVEQYKKRGWLPS